MEMMRFFVCLVTLLLSLNTPLCISQDTIVSAGKTISANQKLISSKGIFALGFFSPKNSTKCFLGIWYNTIPNKPVVWVANREFPLDSPGAFMLRGDGNLVVLDGNHGMTRNVVIWSSNVSVPASAINATTAVLMDTGNFVLRFGEDHSYLWQSFDHLCNTLLPGMKLSVNRRTGQQRRLTSWAALNDPKPGNFTLGIDPQVPAGQGFIWNKNSLYWRSSVYTGKDLKRAFANSTKHAHVTYHWDADEASVTYGGFASSAKVRVILTPVGQLELLLWQDFRNSWSAMWRQPSEKCDFYSTCGPYGVCDDTQAPLSSSPCKCLKGFVPAFRKPWAEKDWPSGCHRKRALTCDRREWFLKHEKMKLPDYAILFENKSMSECQSECRRNCSCTAYAYVTATEEGTGRCLKWLGDLMDLVGNHPFGYDIFIRQHSSELGGVSNADKRSL